MACFCIQTRVAQVSVENALKHIKILKDKTKCHCIRTKQQLQRSTGRCTDARKTIHIYKYFSSVLKIHFSNISLKGTINILSK